MSTAAVLWVINGMLCGLLAGLLVRLQHLRREIGVRDAEARELSAQIGYRDRMLTEQGMMLDDLRTALRALTPPAIDQGSALVGLPEQSASTLRRKSQALPDPPGGSPR